MIVDQLIQAAVTVVGVALSLAYFPQAWRIWKNKSAEDVSTSSYLTIGIGTTTWLLYGLYRDDIVIIASFLFGVVGSWLVLCLTLYFKRKRALRK